MANYSEQQKLKAWEKAQIVEGYKSSEWRKDPAGAWMQYKDYGLSTSYGWTIDHRKPISKGGKDEDENRRAMHWENNQSKGDDHPDYTAVNTSDGNRNIAKKQKLSN